MRLCSTLLLAACAAPAKPVADTGAWVDPRLVFDAVQRCEAPQDAVAYDEVGAAWGLVGAKPQTYDVRTDGGGVAAADLDHDGDLDLILTWEQDTGQVLWQRDGYFEAEPFAGHSLRAPTPVDLDGDGWEDLVVPGLGLLVLRNQQGVLVPEPTLAVEGAGVVREAVAADLDGDGDPDLAALATAPGSSGLQDSILWNQDGALVQDTGALDPEVASRKAFDGVAFDWDGDSATDLYVVNDMGPTWGPNVLWQDQGGQLRDVGGDCACELSMSGMGASVGDYDNDGLADLYLAGTGSSVLLGGQADGRFVDRTLATGADSVDEAGMAWGATWVDYDNDGQLDVAVGRGDFGPGHLDGDPVLQPFQLLRQDGGAFQDVAPALGLDRLGLWRGVLPLELNGDGVQDLLVDAFGEVPLLFLSQGCTADAWLQVQAPLGSRVQVEAGGQRFTAWVTADRGYGAARSPEVWLGLGPVEVVDGLEITLPWGGGTVRADGPLAPRRTVVFRP